MVWHRSASKAWSCFSTPSLTRPGSMPSRWEESWRISSTVMVIVSPVRLEIRQTSWSTTRVHGADIQLRGL